MPQVVTKPNNRQLAFDDMRISVYADRTLEGLEMLDKERLVRGVNSKLRRDEVTGDEISNAFIMSALELVTKEEPNWKFAAARSLLTSLYKKAATNRRYKSYPDEPYGAFHPLLVDLVKKGIYREELLECYTKEQIDELAECIDYRNDLLFDYIGLLTLAERYLAHDFDGKVMELPQERYMVIAMFLMHQEPAERRMDLVKEAYWAMSNMYMTAATPTMSNAGKKVAGQLSSCFIDTVDDSLEGIFDSNTDVARLSKMGGGIGVYLGKVRARGSDIRGHQNTSSGVIPWIRQLNNTAVSVDQLGTRKGAIAVYLDVFHKDILAFLDLKLNNGDERMRAHDVFHGICLPDLFMERVSTRGEWSLFCPHETKKVMGWKDENGRALGLEDFYDESFGEGAFRDKYEEAVNHPLLSRITVQAIDIMKRVLKSQLETGTPYMFYRDTVNRSNPNRAHGMVYSSNLCTEIMQNQSATVIEKEELVTKDGQTRIVISKVPGDFVVCNLNSIHLARAIPHNVLERLVPIQVRMLDNVIDINNIEVLQAQYTNSQYRAVGLGTFGLHHLLALEGIHWESEEAVTYNDNLYEKINYLLVKSSMELSKEKGHYPKFKGSDWESGHYFDQREYTSGERVGEFVTTEQWKELQAEVRQNGVRNAWLFAIAPNGSTSIIAGSTASIDPLYELLSYEEKTTYKIANPAPDLSEKTSPYYQTAFQVDQHASINMAAARQRHVDQGQSFNFYVRPDIKATEFLELHLHAWRAGMKSTYYVRSRALTIEES
ncbi:ribonucleoside-diphosphate reductase subunit alpha [Paenibacillus sp. FSL K6-1122]|uniref:ribonucleoside-diphosphate reductase subunit alpha n=2 Tax=Paenibacillus TaxID=44249 RepID=UPI0003E1BED4|nr:MULTISPECIES: ribonucleoside-diphosphate reductase subunit alpha [Paenibacillus]ETT33510.1 ribonucleotide-diphosphate reductase subunit alpha [Paenibacillus sp. FSL R5-192]ETT53568.1 ribonucleotide-diphosphate reductase subunit alpha [Paenibacillus sp. FSL H7-689]OMF00584.1 ribonucleoside-diphosphate reductase subunit alpha [Paenibacillus amylolyticus]WFA83631.1 ribonucleoside-diphosphate reductase subunit alpha [Paenibacillus amylolyticus]